MRVFTSLTTFTHFIETLAIAATPIMRMGEKSVGALLFASAYRNFGASEKFTPLADSTLEARQNRWGYYKNANVGDGTLLWTGDQRSKLEMVQEDGIAGIGSSDPIMLYQEMGTARIPPRPLFKISAQEIAPEGWEVLRLTAGKMIGIT